MEEQLEYPALESGGNGAPKVAPREQSLHFSANTIQDHRHLALERLLPGTQFARPVVRIDNMGRNLISSR